MDNLEAATPAYNTDELIAWQSKTDARVRELESKTPSFDIDELISRVDSMDGRIDTLTRGRAEPAGTPGTGKRAKRKSTTGIPVLPARRVGPTKRKAAQSRKSTKSKSARVASADEFDIGNFGGSS